MIDTGIGLSSDEIAKLFRPFTQADESTTRRFGGTGLGLSICLRLSENLGGAVVVESEPGTGSTFSVTVDAGALAGVQMLQAADVAGPAPSIADGDVDRVRGFRVLLAEDGLDNQRLFAHLLRKAVANVVCVENGQLACNAFDDAQAATEPFHLILMDMQMPVFDGYGATQRLRAKGCELPIIAMTAHAMDGDRKACLDAGCTDYVTKPLRIVLEITVRFSVA
ncbi:MAG: hypothetical protein CMJ64_00875 [Planctomycetaceae bacterium]|nr:hypothetical protein [Planctomycetaceae bacterium]